MGVTQLVLYGIVATLSPLGFAATLVVIENGRVKALVFAVGLVAAQLAACSVLVAVGTAAVGRDRGHGTFRSLLELGFGLALLQLALVVRRTPESAAASSGERTRAVAERIGNLGLVASLAAGLLLGVGGPKRLVLTALAAATITASGAGDSERALLVVGYTLLATVLVWGPVLVFELLGDRVLVRLHAAQRWLGLHRRAAAYYALLVVGAAAVVDSAVSLLL